MRPNLLLCKTNCYMITSHSVSIYGNLYILFEISPQLKNALSKYLYVLFKLNNLNKISNIKQKPRKD